MLLTLLNKLPLSEKGKVAFGAVGIISFCAATMFYKPKKAGHGAFDVDKPEAVQANLDRAEEARLARFRKGTTTRP